MTNWRFSFPKSRRLTQIFKYKFSNGSSIFSSFFFQLKTTHRFGREWQPQHGNTIDRFYQISLYNHHHESKLRHLRITRSYGISQVNTNDVFSFVENLNAKRARFQGINDPCKLCTCVLYIMTHLISTFKERCFLIKMFLTYYETKSR